MRWVHAQWCLGVLALLLAGCAPSYAPPRRLPADPAGSDVWGAAAVAVHPNGDEEFAWSEQVAGQGRVVRLRARQGFAITQTVLAPAGPGLYLYPQLAVADGGTTYMVWQARTGVASQPSDCWEAFPYPGSQAVCQALADPPGDAYGLPSLAGRGEAIYAIYGVPDGAGSALHYRQLDPMDRSRGAVALPGGNLTRRASGAGVDRAGDLHVAWLEDAGAGQAALHYNDNVGTTGAMTDEHLIARGTLAGADLAVDNQIPGTTYMVWVDKTDPASHQVQLAYCSLSCAITGTAVLLPRDAARHWQVVEAPSVAANADGAYVTLAAANDQTQAGGAANPEIWLIAFRQLQPGTPIRITNNTLPDGPPRIVVTALGLVIGWRQSAAPGTFADAFSYDPVGGVRQIFGSPQGPGAYGPGALAARDDFDWVAGIWIDHPDQSDPRLVPWVSFNVYRQGFVFAPPH